MAGPMDRQGSEPTASPGAVEPADPEALQDARAVLERIEADEAAASAARLRFAAEPLPVEAVDFIVAPHLGPNERVFAHRAATLLDRDGPSRSPAEGPSTRGGILYLTSSRLLLVGDELVEVALGAIREIHFAGERLLLALSGGEGVRITTAQPRLFRVQLAAAITAARSEQTDD